jgi:hypothetical protein
LLLVGVVVDILLMGIQVEEEAEAEAFLLA